MFSATTMVRNHDYYPAPWHPPAPAGGGSTESEGSMADRDVKRGGIPGEKVLCLFSRIALAIMITIAMLHVPGSFNACAAQNPLATITSLDMAPLVVEPGRYPDITAHISAAGNESMEVSVVAVVVRPDHVVKSWQWKKVSIVSGEKRSLAIPHEFGTRLTGVYKVEFVIYSMDMARRIHALSRTFTVAEASKVQPKVEPQVRKELDRKPAQERERTYLGIGVYGNSLNPAGGATILLWPFRNVGLQGIYTVGVFTSYEGRLLLKFKTSSGVNPYLGAGFLNVSTEKKVIDIDTAFEDSTVSGVAGIELRLGNRGRGYVEVSGAAIKLEKDVTNGTQSAHAEVKYIPVTIGLGFVWTIF